jgi:hypothetical protein
MSRGKRFESARRLSRFGVDKRDIQNRDSLRFMPGVSLHHRYISEAWLKLTQMLLPRNALRNALETVVL